MKELKLEIEYIPTESLTPYKNNAKLHPQEQIEQIKNSITEFGMDDPIGVYGEENLIVEGHGRLIACQQLGIKEVPVIRLDHLTEEQRKAYTITHNKLTMNTGFDLAVLEKELQEIDLDMANFGFVELAEPDIEIEDDGFEFDEEEEEPVETIAKPGELYRLGDHFLMCGDSTKREDVERLMGEARADLALTDPPYNVNVSNSQGMTIMNDNLEASQFKKMLEGAFVNMSSVMKPGAAFYVWYGSSEGVTFEQSLYKAELSVRQQLIWVKNTFNLGRQDYQWRHEPCLYGWKEGEGHYFIYDRTQDTVIEEDPIDFETITKEEAVKLLKKVLADEYSTIIKQDKPIKNILHPSMKPLGLVGRLIKNSSKKGEVVLDLFGGSGSTLIACEQLERKCYMMELDPHYVDVIIERWESLTGKKAEKVG